MANQSMGSNPTGPKGKTTVKKGGSSKGGLKYGAGAGSTTGATTADGKKK